MTTNSHHHEPSAIGRFQSRENTKSTLPSCEHKALSHQHIFPSCSTCDQTPSHTSENTTPLSGVSAGNSKNENESASNLGPQEMMQEGQPTATTSTVEEDEEEESRAEASMENESAAPMEINNNNIHPVNASSDNEESHPAQQRSAVSAKRNNNNGRAPITAHLAQFVEQSSATPDPEPVTRSNNAEAEQTPYKAPPVSFTEVPFVSDGMSALLTSLCARNKQEVIPSSDFHSHCLPPMTIKPYMDRLVRYCHGSGEALLCSLLLLLKYTVFSGHPITIYNVHRLLITSVVLGIKMRDDTYYNNQHYARIGGIQRSEMNKLEVLFLSKMGWHISVGEEEYLKARHLLEQILEEPTDDALLEFQRSCPQAMEAYDPSLDEEIHIPKRTATQAEADSTEAVSEAEAARARVLGAYKQYRWTTLVEPWLSELERDTVSKYESQAVTEADNWEAEGAKWARYRSEDAAKLQAASQRSSSSDSRWMSPMSINNTAAFNGSGGYAFPANFANYTTSEAVLGTHHQHQHQQQQQRGPRYANYAQYNNNNNSGSTHTNWRGGSASKHSVPAATMSTTCVRGYPSTPADASNSFGISNRTAEPTTAPAPPLSHHSNPNSTGINVNAQPYYYASSSVKRKAAAAAAAAAQQRALGSPAPPHGGPSECVVPSTATSNFPQYTNFKETSPSPMTDSIATGASTHVNYSNWRSKQAEDRSATASTNASRPTMGGGPGEQQSVGVASSHRRVQYFTTANNNNNNNNDRRSAGSRPTAVGDAFPSIPPTYDSDKQQQQQQHQPQRKPSNTIITSKTAGKKRPKPDAYSDAYY